MAMKNIYIRPEMTMIEIGAECEILAGSTKELEMDNTTTLPGDSFNSKNHNFSIWGEEDE
ncbi:MAG: hypothetical protein J6K19_03970 [Prevotella sp.]|nr:hypothetical protein [Prevotella sp.]MBP3511180.1 hypothetical protein [Prevotella sp.]